MNKLSKVGEISDFVGDISEISYLSDKTRTTGYLFDESSEISHWVDETSDLVDEVSEISYLVDDHLPWQVEHFICWIIFSEINYLASEIRLQGGRSLSRDARNR